MPFSARAIANEFLRLAEEEGKKLTPMALIKFVYYAHGWYLALTGEPLLNENVEAWKFGPVVPSLYQEFKEFGMKPITRRARVSRILDWTEGEALIGEDAEVAKRIIKRVWDVYKGLSAVQLSNLTHQPDSPWSLTPNKEFRGTDIPNDLIKKYFENLSHKNDRQTEAK
jgi:uncharacterized phage-associated protein